MSNLDDQLGDIFRELLALARRVATVIDQRATNSVRSVPRPRLPQCEVESLVWNWLADNGADYDRAKTTMSIEDARMFTCRSIAARLSKPGKRVTYHQVAKTTAWKQITSDLKTGRRYSGDRSATVPFDARGENGLSPK